MCSLDLNKIYILWCSINIIGFITYLYFVFQGLLFLIDEKEMIEKDTSIEKALPLFIIVEFLFVFIFLIKMIVMIVYKYIFCADIEKIIGKLYFMEGLSLIPYFIGFIVWIIQLNYYNNNFTLKNEFQENKNFKAYFIIKFISGFIFIISFMFMCLSFVITMLSASGLCKCKCCWDDPKIINNKIYPY